MMRLLLGVVLAAIVTGCGPTQTSPASETTVAAWAGGNEVDATCRALEGDAARVSGCFALAELLQEDGCSIGAFREVISGRGEAAVEELNLSDHGCRTDFQPPATSTSPPTTGTPTTSTISISESTTSTSVPTEGAMSWKVVTESLENTDIVGLYPITGDTAIDAQIEAFIAEFTDAYLPQLESIRSQGYRSELAYRLNPSVITGSLAAFRFTGSFYAAGGANPTQLVDALVLNELGQVVDPLAGFTDSGGLLVNLVIQQIGSNPDYFLPEDGLLPYAAWIPASQGMIAGFDEYEIAAGYLGTQEIDIGWEELSEAIDPNGIYQDVTDGWLTSVPFLVPP